MRLSDSVRLGACWLVLDSRPMWCPGDIHVARRGVIVPQCRNPTRHILSEAPPGDPIGRGFSLWRSRSAPSALIYSCDMSLEGLVSKRCDRPYRVWQVAASDEGEEPGSSGIRPGEASGQFVMLRA